MSTNLLLVDLDGTVRRCKSNPAGFINAPLDQEIIPEALASLQRWKHAGAEIVACTNQGDVAAGYKTLGACIDEQVETMRLAPQIKAVLFCPDSCGTRCFFVLPDGSTNTITTRTFQPQELSIRSFRKPACGMLLAAMHRYRAQPADTVFVGDRDEDRLAAISAGVNFMPAEMWWATETVEAVEDEA